MHKIAFSTDALPERDRFAMFCEEIGRRFSGLDLRTNDRAGYRASVEVKIGDAISLGRSTTTPVDTVRTPSLVRDGDDSLLLLLLTDGQACYRSDREEERLAVGDAIICDCSLSGAYNLLTPASFLTVKLARRELVGLLPKSIRLSGRRLNGDPVALRLLFEYLAGTYDIDLSRSPGAEQAYKNHVLALATLALGVAGEHREHAEKNGAQAVRRAAIMRDMQAYMEDPALDATTIALRLGITPRYVHVLLQPTGLTFSEHLLDARLARAGECLRDPGQRERRIADIAHQVGFRDLSHFNRAFRRKFGGTPTDIRQVANSRTRE